MLPGFLLCLVSSDLDTCTEILPENKGFNKRFNNKGFISRVFISRVLPMSIMELSLLKRRFEHFRSCEIWYM